VKSESALGGDYLSPPGLGSDSEEVLRSLGYSAEEIAELAAKGTVRLEPN
jgi:crotonobetainyl-CoA:carnitine CoA-transferase CaiB-like acyl-CoA transferase